MESRRGLRRSRRRSRSRRATRASCCGPGWSGRKPRRPSGRLRLRRPSNRSTRSFRWMRSPRR
ncbi:hypothetical protein GC169_11040 [bacterium]|nr:hypothetical protein [bacterium]